MKFKSNLYLAFRYLWACYFLLLFTIFFLLFYPFFVILLFLFKAYPAAHFLRRVWGLILMRLSFLFPDTRGIEHIDKNSNYVIVANHFSYLDILSLNVQIPLYFRFVAKHELAKIPLFKIFFKTIDIPIDRSSRTSGAKAYQRCIQALKKGESIGIFPEGKIGDAVPLMSRFKGGAIKMAIETGTPILPITILDNWIRLPEGGIESGGTPGKMRVIVHKPIETRNKKESDVVDLQRKIRDLIQQTFNRYNLTNE
jgi:1-acyl-sn-glycerol-3-phosphate acyltransferase